VDLTPAEIVRQSFVAFGTRDHDSAAPIYHPEVVYDCSLRVLNPEVYLGHEGLRRLTDEIEELWEAFDIVVEEYVEVDDERVIALMTSSARGRSSGIELVDQKAASMFTVRDGRIVHVKLFPDRADAFAEAGIPHGETE
jgi:ketosteroid isomerase-like protein